MRQLIALTFALVFTACGEHRYGEDKQGTYGKGPTVSACIDAATCGATASAAAAAIRSSDAEFERRYAGGALDRLVADYLSDGHAKRASVRIVKARLEGDRIRAFVAVTDAAGEPTTDLVAAELQLARIAANGLRTPVPLHVVGPAYGRVPMQIALVLDHSGSMTKSIDALHVGAKQLVAALPETAFAVVKFGSLAELMQPMTRDATALDEAIDGPYRLGSTALFDGIAAGVAAHGAAADTEAVTLGVVFTDGVENASSLGYDALKSALNLARVPQLVLGMGQVDMKSLITMAEDTNGVFQYLPDATQIGASMAYAARAIQSIVEIEVPLAEAPGLVPEDLLAEVRGP